MRSSIPANPGGLSKEKGRLTRPGLNAAGYNNSPDTGGGGNQWGGDDRGGGETGAARS